ncbi:hypothetical protein [Amycolatopsis suaedae]|uniref:DUF3137 domain-containing protein n=1 Tax=Amycolatopsis suaedae TaxID=2510978 RepID=A0A4Q7JCY3_9PSEU|nr:hypothetical protein [Amycolatopsis suaedae]RZQ65197.1 hypothetical protein EWH70_04720 [Amycolatopsis suaedae]
MGIVILVVALVVIVVVAVVYVIIQRPRHQAGAARHVDIVQTMAATYGWQIDRQAIDIHARLPRVNDTFGSGNGYGIHVGTQLSGAWRGVPIQIVQISFRNVQRMVEVRQVMTVLLMPRPVPGPHVVLTAQGMSWTNFLASDRQVGHPGFDTRFHIHARDDQSARATINPALADLLAVDPRVQERIFFFGDRDIAVAFPGHVTQQQVLLATADLLLEVGQRMAVR